MGVTGGNGDAVRGELAQGGRPWDLQVMEGVPFALEVRESERRRERGGGEEGRQATKKEAYRLMPPHPHTISTPISHTSVYAALLRCEACRHYSTLALWCGSESVASTSPTGSRLAPQGGFIQPPDVARVGWEL